MTIFQKHAAILNADAESARQIDAGLSRTHRAHGHGIFVAHVGAGRFMDLQADAVTVAVSKVRAVACVRDQLTGSAVNIAADGTCLGNSQACQLCLQNGVVPFFISSVA